MRKNFPIMSKVIPFIPWDMIAPHEAQAQRNHSQTLDRLAERGGLAPSEALDIMAGRDWDGSHFVLPEQKAEYAVFKAEQEKKLTDALVAWAVKNGAMAEPETP